MVLEDNDFPVVRMHYDRHKREDGETAFETFERLLHREQLFVLVGLGASAHQDGPEERKQVSLWMKRNRESLRRFVIATVVVEPQAANRFVARSQAEIYEKFWGFPMLVTESEEKALAIALRLLSGEAVSEIDVDEAHVSHVR